MHDEANHIPDVAFATDNFRIVSGYHSSAPGPACSRRPVVAHGAGTRRPGRTAKTVEDAPRGPRVEQYPLTRQHPCQILARG